MIRGERLTAEVDQPYGEGTDHARGLGLLGAPANGRPLVVYDSPSPIRLSGDGVLADVVTLTSTGSGQ